MRATDSSRSRLRESKVLDLARSDQFLHGTRNFLDRHRWVYPVLVEEVDAAYLEPAQHGIDHFSNVFRMAVQTAGAFSRLRVDVESKLGGDHNLIAKWCERFTNEFFVR